ncbi:MAG: hypothetical protein ACOVOR_01765 [Rhabdochlamydiaceae bacterium]
MMRLTVFLTSLFLLLSSCSFRPSDQHRKEGIYLIKELTKKLHNIKSREQLLLSGSDLSKLFDRFVDLIIEAKKYRLKHVESCSIGVFDDLEDLNQKLIEELKRIYAFEGGREFIESLQREPMIRLDAFNSRIKQEKFNHLP